jgi:hypothetical protein
MTGGRGEARDVNALAASLRAHGQDVSLYAGMLLNTLSSALPHHMTHVERERGFLRHKDRAIRAVTIHVSDRRFRLSREGVGAAPVATVEHIVRGIVLSVDTVPLTEWSDLLASELTEAAQQDSGVARAIDALITGPAG